MSTRIEWSKKGLKLVCETDKRPVPRTGFAFPLPDFGTDVSTQLTLALEWVPVTGRMGIRVTSGELPFVPGRIWTLYHAAYVGAAPAVITWEPTGIQSESVNLLIDSPLADATHEFYLSASDGARVVDFPAVSIVTPANELLTALLSFGDDGLLTTIEKPAFLIRWNQLLSDYAALKERAVASGVPYTDFDAAYQAVVTYTNGLPDFQETTVNTVLTATPGSGLTPAETYRKVWTDWNTAYTEMIIRVTTAAPGTVAAVTASGNYNLSVNAAAPSVDGYAPANGDRIMFRHQTNGAENGVYTTVVTSGSQTAQDYAATTATPSGPGSFTAGPGSGSALDTDADYSILQSADDDPASEEVVFSGWSGTWGTGTLHMVVTPRYAGGTTQVFYSTDAGATYTLARSFNTLDATSTDVTVDLVGITPANLRVKVVSIPKRVKVSDGMGGFEFVYYGTEAWVHSIYFHTLAVGASNWAFVPAGELPNVPTKSVWRVVGGTTLGRKTYTATVVGTTITLTETTAAYESPLPVNTAGVKILQDNNGVKTWVDPTTAGVAWGGITGDIEDQTDLILQLDRKVNLTGFDDPSAVTVSYNSTNRTITLTGTFVARHKGDIVAALTNGWVSAAHAATSGPWFLYWNGSAFVWSQTAWTFDNLMIAYANYDSVTPSKSFGIREPHGLMDALVHEELHSRIGTYLVSGGDLGGYTLNSTTAAERRPSVTATTVKDEDLKSVITALADNGPYTQVTLTGTGTTTFTAAATDILPLSGSQPYFNEFTGGNWVQTLVPTGDYTSCWLVAVPTTADAGSLAYRYLWFQGQSAEGNLSAAQATTFASMNLGQLESLFTEFAVIGKVIVRYIGGNWQIVQVDKLTTSRVGSVTTASGNFLSAVAVTAPLTGSGIAADPLALAYTPINKAGDTGIGALSMGALTATTGVFNGLTYVRSATDAMLYLQGNGAGSGGLLLQNTAAKNAYLYNMDAGSLYLGTSGALRLSINASGAANFQSNSVTMGALTATTATLSGALTGTYLNLASGSTQPSIFSSTIATATGLFTYNEVLRLRNADATNGNGTLIGFRDSSDTIVALMGAVVTDHATHAAALAFGTRNGGAYAERLRINADGSSDFKSNAVTMGALTATTGNFSGNITLPKTAKIVNAGNGAQLMEGLFSGIAEAYSSCALVMGTNIKVDPADAVNTQIRIKSTHASIGYGFWKIAGNQTSFYGAAGSVVANDIIVPVERFRIVDASVTSYVPFTANAGLVVATGYASVKATPGTYGFMLRTDADVAQWVMSGNGALAGADAGNDWTLSRYSDAGAWLSNPIVVNRATGNVALSSTTASNNYTTGALTIAGGLGVTGSINSNGNIIAAVSLISNGSISCNSAAGTPYFELKNAGVRRFLIINNSSASQTSFSMYDAAAALIDSPITIQNAAAGQITMASTRPVSMGPLTAASGAFAGGIGIGTGQAANGSAGIWMGTGGLTSASTAQYGIVCTVVPSVSATTFTSLYAQTAVPAGGALSNAYGLRVLDINKTGAGTGTATNNYGIYINAMTGGTTGNYALYANAGLTRFADTTAATAFNVASVVMSGGLGVAGNIYAASAIFGPNYVADAAAGVAKGIYFRTGNVSRWYVSSDSAAESGSDAGSLFRITAYTDAGASIDVAFSIVRAAGGTITMARPVNVTGALGLNSTTQTLDRSSNDLRWRYDGTNYGTVLHTGNLTANAAAFQAIVASATAPLVGTIAQRTAYTPATGTTPYWYATDETAPDGLLGTLRQWNGSAWGAAANPQTVTGRVIAGVISAGAIGTNALAANSVTAAKLEATLIMTSVIQSTGYTAGTSSVVATGFKLSGADFTATYLDGTTGSVKAEFGGNVSIGGWKAVTIGDRIAAVNRITNGFFYQGLAPWGTSGVTPPTFSAATATAGSGSAGITASATTATGAVTKTGSIYQAFTIPKALTANALTMTFKTGIETGSPHATNSGGSVKVYIFNSATGVETLVDTFTYTNATGVRTLAWTTRTSTMTTLLSAGGDFVLRFEISVYQEDPASGTQTCTIYVDEVVLNQ